MRQGGMTSVMGPWNRARVIATSERRMESRGTAKGLVGVGRSSLVVERQGGMVGTAIERARKRTGIVGGNDRSMLCHIA